MPIDHSDAQGQRITRTVERSYGQTAIRGQVTYILDPDAIRGAEVLEAQFVQDHLPDIITARRTSKTA